MQKNLMIFCLVSMLMACHTTTLQQNEPIIGGEQDEHGCMMNAGQTWSYLKQQCVQIFNEADIRLKEVVNHTTYGIYVIVSEDSQKAEVFSVRLPENTILTKVSDGFSSDDGSIRLIKQGKEWGLIIQP